MKFSGLSLFITSALGVPAQLETTQPTGDVSANLPQQTINVFNDIFKNSLIPIANSKLPNVIEKAKIDPFSGISGSSKTPSVDAKICQLSANIDYNIQNMTGLKDVQIDNLALINAVDSTNGSLILNLGGASNNFTINAMIEGTVVITCNVPLSPIHFTGIARVDQVTIAVKHAQAIASLSTEQIALTSIDLQELESNFGSVTIAINHLNDPFGQILVNDIIAIVSNKFKHDITGLVNDQLKSQLNGILHDQLPLNAPSALLSPTAAK